MNEIHTTKRRWIAVSDQTFQALKKKGEFGESWDQLLARLAKESE